MIGSEMTHSVHVMTPTGYNVSETEGPPPGDKLTGAELSLAKALFSSYRDAPPAGSVSVTKKQAIEVLLALTVPTRCDKNKLFYPYSSMRDAAMAMPEETLVEIESSSPWVGKELRGIVAAAKKSKRSFAVKMAYETTKACVATCTRQRRAGVLAEEKEDT